MNISCNHTARQWEPEWHQFSPTFSWANLKRTLSPVMLADKPYLWYRYIDDILMVWRHEEDKLNNFNTYLNNIHPTIKFTSEHSTTSIPFLDFNIQLANRRIETDPFSVNQQINTNICYIHQVIHSTRKSQFRTALLSDCAVYLFHRNML